MPRPPGCAADVAAIPEAVFSPLASALDARAAGLVPLHVGDTWLEPFEGGRMQDLCVAAHAGHDLPPAAIDQYTRPRPRISAKFDVYPAARRPAPIGWRD